MSWHDMAFDVAYFFIKSPFRNLWPLIVAPAAAAWISDHSARLLPRTPQGSIPAAALAALPGLVALAMIVHAIDFIPIITWRGWVAHRITPFAAAALLAFALIRAVLRQSRVMRLFSVATAASGRLSLAAVRLGLTAMELQGEDKECFVAGLFKPAAFVSRRALESLNDAELEAALLHERAHIAGRDTLCLAILAFLRDLAPWGRGEAFDAFRAAREAAADEAAAGTAGSLNLAAALIALARPQHHTTDASGVGSVILPMARGSNVLWRLKALLDGGSRKALSVGERLRTAGGFCFCAALLTWPLVQVRLIEFLCIVQ